MSKERAGIGSKEARRLLAAGETPALRAASPRVRRLVMEMFGAETTEDVQKDTLGEIMKPSTQATETARERARRWLECMLRHGEATQADDEEHKRQEVAKQQKQREEEERRKQEEKERQERETNEAIARSIREQVGQAGEGLMPPNSLSRTPRQKRAPQS